MELQLGRHCNETFVQVNGFCPLRGWGSRHLAVKVENLGQKSLRENYGLYTLFSKIREKMKYVSTFSLYINKGQNNMYQCFMIFWGKNIWCFSIWFTKVTPFDEFRC